MPNKTKPKNVDEYIRAAPDHAREKLNQIRQLLKSIAPNATEDLKWGQPVFIEKRILFSYTAFKNHLNFMPTGQSLDPFRDELLSFKTSKHTLQLDYDNPLPTALIKKIAKHRYKDVVENDAKWMY